MRDRKSDRYRDVQERKMGRKLQPHEVVDHINEDKTDDSPANLRTMDRGKHTSQHNKGRKVSKLRASLRMVKEGKKIY